MSADNNTRYTLVDRLRGRDQSRRDCHDLYVWLAPQIIAFARRHGLDESEAMDVVQETMSKVFEMLATGMYHRRDGVKFRTWVFSIVRFEIHRAFRRRASNAKRLGESLDAPIPGADGRCLSDFLSIPELDLEEAVMKDADEARLELAVLDVALDRVRSKYSHAEFDALHGYVLDRYEAAYVAKVFHTNLNVAYQRRDRFLEQLRRAILVISADHYAREASDTTVFQPSGAEANEALVRKLRAYPDAGDIQQPDLRGVQDRLLMIERLRYQIDPTLHDKPVLVLLRDRSVECRVIDSGWTVGRGAQATWQVMGLSGVSREHFQVAPEGEFLLLMNRSATNPVEVNDLGAVQSRLLVNGDVIRAGVAEFVFLDASGE